MSYCTVPPMAFTFAAELVVQATSALCETAVKGSSSVGSMVRVFTL